MMTPRYDIVGQALGDTSRSRMLCELMEGRAFTNKELALAAGVTAQTATAHLKILQAAGLIRAEKSGRCVYHRIAGPEIAAMLEQLAIISPSQDLYLRQRRRAGSLSDLRSCYDHLAGPLAVRMTEVFLERGMLVHHQGAFRTGRPGLWASLGIPEPDQGCHGKSPVARPCLDWTERKPHLAGPLAREILKRGLNDGWFVRRAAVRGLAVTEKGQRVLKDVLGIDTESLVKGSEHV